MNITDMAIFGLFLIIGLLGYCVYTYAKGTTELLIDMAVEIDKLFTDMAVEIDRLRKEVDELKGVKEDDGK